jgi:uncharacterized membrane protein YbhN (UPF0104 family)
LMHRGLAKIRGLNRQRWFRSSLAASGLVVAVVIIGGLVYRNWSQFQTFNWQVNPLPLIGVAGALVVTFGLNLLTWHLISHTFGSRVGFWKDSEIYSFSTIVRRVPGAIWQLAGRTYLYHQADTTLAVPLWGTFWEIVVQVSSGFFVTLLMLLFSPRLLDELPGGSLWLLALIPIGWLVFRPQDVVTIARRLVPRLSGVPELDWRKVAVWLGLYTLIWITGGTILYLLICAFGQSALSLYPVSVALVAASGVLAIIVSPIPGGLGAREIALTFLLQLYVQSPVAVTVTILLRLTSLLGEALIAFLVFLAARGKHWWSQSPRNTP